MAVLQSRLDQLEMVRQAQMNAQHTQSLTDITWGSQIRSYVLHVHSGTLLVSIAKFYGPISMLFLF
jgi:protein subunit release factor B